MRILLGNLRPVYNLCLRSRSLIVFAKAPVAGRVKTRLVPPLTAAQAARLHEAFVGDLLERLAGCDGDVVLSTDIPTDAWGEFAVARKLQSEGDLGVRMYESLQDALADGYRQAVILGADAPALPRAHLDALLALDADVALGAAEDGGYWGIAARRVHPAMFSGVRWSGAAALADTEAALRACGLTAARGPVWFDVDTAADLQRLRAGELPRRTASVLAGLLP